jgi:hypothetical protein
MFLPGPYLLRVVFWVRRLVVGTGSASDASAFIVAFYRRDINYHGVGGAGIVLSTEAWPRLK